MLASRRRQQNLAYGYQSRTRGDRADNLEKAVAAYHAALEVFTRESHPREWEYTQHDLGLAYQARILGDPADNRERAIAAFLASLEIATRESNPHGCVLALSRWNAAHPLRDLKSPCRIRRATMRPAWCSTSTRGMPLAL